MHKQRILKLRGDQERRRFFVGVSIDPDLHQVVATLVAATGRGIEARLDIASHVALPIPPEVVAAIEPSAEASAGRVGRSRLTDRLTEAAAAAVDALGVIEHEVWPTTFLCGVMSACDGCDAALLAEMTHLNVIDGIAARDTVVGGSGNLLDALPLWMLLHHAELQRTVVQSSPGFRLLHLPASRDERGVQQIDIQTADTQAELQPLLANRLNRQQSAPVGELLWMAADGAADQLRDELLCQHPTLTIQTPATLGISADALRGASAAVLAMLHIDQTPANLPFLTGAVAPRVLGRLTPGSAKAWNRLLRDLAFSRPLVTPLRAAV